MDYYYYLSFRSVSKFGKNENDTHLYSNSICAISRRLVVDLLCSKSRTNLRLIAQMEFEYYRQVANNKPTRSARPMVPNLKSQRIKAWCKMQIVCYPAGWTAQLIASTFNRRSQYANKVEWTNELLPQCRPIFVLQKQEVWKKPSDYEMENQVWRHCIVPSSGTESRKKREIVPFSYTVSQKKTRKLWNGIAQNCKDRFWCTICSL